MLEWTHKCRIYRASLSQRHDLSFLRTSEDIYEADKSCRVMPSEGSLLEIPAQGELGAVSRPAEIWFPRGLDISEGYVIAVRKPRVINAEIEPVSGTLTADADAGDTEVEVDSTIGFESGDVCTLADETNTQRVIVADVDTDGTITFYTECALKYDFLEDDSTLTAETFYKVMSRLTPHSVGPIIQASVIEMAHGSVS